MSTTHYVANAISSHVFEATRQVFYRQLIVKPRVEKQLLTVQLLLHQWGRPDVFTKMCTTYNNGLRGMSEETSDLKC